MNSGRPVGSVIRQNILEILFYLGKGYGYQISKIYNEIFPQVTQRSIYYHLNKGLLTQEIAIKGVEQEKGDFSWRSEVEKKFYMLGKNALAKGDKRVQEYLEKYGEKTRAVRRQDEYI